MIGIYSVCEWKSERNENMGKSPFIEFSISQSFPRYEIISVGIIVFSSLCLLFVCLTSIMFWSFMVCVFIYRLTFVLVSVVSISVSIQVYILSLFYAPLFPVTVLVISCLFCPFYLGEHSKFILSVLYMSSASRTSR